MTNREQQFLRWVEANTFTYATEETAQAAAEIWEPEIKRLRDALQRISYGECNCRRCPELCNCASKIADDALVALNRKDQQ